jgi:hypothetical protein
MIKDLDFVFFPEQLHSRPHVIKSIAAKLNILESDIKDYRILRKSIDARKSVRFNVKLQIISFFIKEL